MRLYTHTHTHTHTGDLLENKNRINKRDICINASNFGVQLKKEKDNNSGRRGRRPLQVPKSNLGITLIALIITIIVLLILAGVTLNMVMGENGIFGKANNAKNKTEVAQYEEELRMCVLELQTDVATNGTTFNMDTIKNKFVEKVKELENTTEIEFPTEESETRLDGTYKGYEFYIDDKYAAHIGNKATGISLTTSINPSGWTQGPVTATITIKSNNGINKVEPDEGSKNGNEYIITKENIAENTNFEYTVTDGQGNTQTKTAVINTIDKNPPADFTITAENTEEGLKITGETTDAESGIDKYEYYAKKSDDEYKKYESNPITGLASGTYSVYVIAYDKAGNIKQSNTVEEVKISKIYSNITAQMVAEHPEIYYGLSVTNYESQNGQKDWKIFYSDWNENPDDAHIFLITGDYVDINQENRLDSSAEMIIKGYNSYYCAYWASIPSFQTVDDEVLTRFKATGYELKKETTNSKCTSTLLNTSNWTKYLDNENGTEKAESAIGGPTIEMWMASWNQRYPNDKLYWNVDENKSGYYVGTSEKTKSTVIMNETMNTKKGYKEKLYYPHTADDIFKYCESYWISSPSANGTGDMYCINCYGAIPKSRFGYYNTSYCDQNVALRPVVSLKKDITVNAKDSE